MSARNVPDTSLSWAVPASIEISLLRQLKSVVLACAVTAQQAIDLALLKREGNTPQDFLLPKLLLDSIEDQFHLYRIISFHKYFVSRRASSCGLL